MKYAFVTISVIGFIFTTFATDQGAATGLGIATCGFAIAAALLLKK